MDTIWNEDDNPQAKKDVDLEETINETCTIKEINTAFIELKDTPRDLGREVGKDKINVLDISDVDTILTFDTFSNKSHYTNLNKTP